MTKKELIGLADAIKRDNHREGEQVWSDYHLGTLVDFFAESNPRFMRDRWIDYIQGKCGKNGGKV